MRTTIFLSFAIPALAQFSNFVTTKDGSQLYFSSTLQLTGSTDISADPKIFRYDGTHFYLYAHLAKISSNQPSKPGPQYTINSNYYSLKSPFASGSGAVTGYVGYADCNNCGYDRILPAQTTFQFAGALGSLVLPYDCDVSTNSRYALCQTTASINFARPAMFIDLFSLQQTQTTTACFGDTHYMTTSGSVLLTLTNSYALWSPPSGSTTISLPSAPVTFSYSCPMISNDGSLIVYVSTDGLAIYNVATQTATPLVANQIVNRSGYPVSLLTISDDARWILAAIYDGSQWQLVIVDSSSDSTRQLASGVSSGIQTATLSGDGSTAYVVTANGALLKINVQSSVSQVIAETQPSITSIDGAPAPGSLNRIFGNWLTGAQVTLNGSAIPFTSSTATEVDVQIPWETPVGAATIQVSPATPAAFQQLWPLQIQTFDPVAETQAIHQDFSGGVTPTSPAIGGEVVNYYFTGLGPVSPPVADAKPAGTNPLSVVTTSLTLVSDPAQAPAQLLYAGLAPGTVGLYQVSIQLPANINRGPFFQIGAPVLFSLTLNGSDIPAWVRSNQ
jgi:uncharacterized protein (TIGR03437 family)